MDLLDLNNQVGVDEMVTYANEAIAAAESLIMRTREDYFMTNATLALVQGAKDIQLPADIYAQKIREITYINSARIYPLRRLKDPRMMFHQAVINYSATSLVEYKYFLWSPAAGQQDVLRITPPALESGPFLDLWYIRNANRVPLQAAPDNATRATQLATPIDIPEWRSYVEQFMRVRCYEKMKLMDQSADAKQTLNAISESMVVTLKDRMEDNENEIPMDQSHYEDHN
jgi:hypothetical protein